MALTPLQLAVCRLIAQNRIAGGESYVAGGAALNQILGASRVSRDLDLFHDAAEAVATSWDADRGLLQGTGYDVRPVRERPGFVEAVVTGEGGSVVLQWASDSAYRFFPLVAHDDFGLVLHPFDLATNKVLALVGRLEPRDWVDVLTCHRHVQPLGYLAWAACGKDPGFNPASILEHAARSGRYTDVEIASLAFEGSPPIAADLSATWHAMLEEAREIVSSLPAASAGCCVLGPGNELFRLPPARIPDALARGDVVFHAGSLGGALPKVVER